MRLNKTYPLEQMFHALNVASRNWKEVAMEMKKTGKRNKEFIEYEAEGMLTTSPSARVTLTRQVSESRWEGYMETSLYRDGPKEPVAVNRHIYVLFANDDFTKFVQYEANENGYPVEELFTHTLKTRR